MRERPSPGRKNNRVRYAVLAALFLAAAIALAYGYGEHTSAPAFLTAPVERGSISTVVSATGAVDALAKIDVSSQLSGQVANVFVDFNDRVSAGQPLAQIDPQIYAAGVNEAKAGLHVARAWVEVQAAAVERAKVVVANGKIAKKQAEAQSAAARARQDELDRDYLRKLELARTGSGTERDLSAAQAARDAGNAELRAALDEIEMRGRAIAMAEAELRMAEANLDNARATVEQKEATLDQARVDLARTVLRAPIDGIIIKRDVNPGQTVAVTLEAKTLFTIANDLREMEVEGKIDEADIGQLRVGQVVRFTVDAYPDRTFRGRVRQIRKSPDVVQNVVTYTAVISAPNPDLLLLPGMTAELQIVVRELSGVLKIPSQALRFRPDNGEDRQSTLAVAEANGSNPAQLVWIIGAEGRPKPVAVKLGASDNNSSELLGGKLAEGQRLIVGVAAPRNGHGYFGLRLGF